MISRQVAHMMRLVEDLTEASRISRGKLDLQKEPTLLTSVIQHAVETSRPLVERGRHRLSVSTTQEPLWVDGDPVRLAQVFANLLNNAAKYTEDEGHIEISSRRDGAWAVVKVSDNGIGIEAVHMARLFQLFAQLDSGRARSQGGLGIGLSLAQRLVELHGGSIEAASDGPGHGSTFTVRLPLLPAPAQAPAATAAGADLRGRRVLLVDDNRDAAESMGLLLEDDGAEVRIAHDGAQALDAVRAWLPHIAFIDLGMPVMDGEELARRLRGDPRFDGVKLVALTGWGQEADRARTTAAGFDAHLVKPVDLDLLEQLVAALTPVSQ